MKTNNIAPDVITFTALVKGYVHAGDMEGALKVIQEVMDTGIEPDTKLWNELMEGFAKRGDAKAMMDLCDMMKQHKVATDPVTLRHLIQGFKKCNDSRAIIKWYEELKSMDGVNGTAPPLLNAVLHAYGKVGDFTKLMETFRMIKSRQWPNDQMEFAYHILLSALGSKIPLMHSNSVRTYESSKGMPPVL